MVCQFSFNGPRYAGVGIEDYATFESLIESLLSGDVAAAATKAGFGPRTDAGAPAADAAAGEGGEATKRTFRPRLDVVEVKEGYVVTVELPGVKKEDVNISFEKNRVTVAGEVKSPAEHTDGTVKVAERRYGTFTRTINVPEGTPVENIRARFEDGLLKLEVPKPSEETLAKKKIEIQ